MRMNYAFFLHHPPPPELASSPVTSPPHTIERVTKLNTKLLTELKENSNRFRKHVQRCMDGSALLAQQLALTKRELSKFRAEKTKREAYKNRKTMLDASNIALSPAHASRRIKQRLESDTKKLMRLQEKMPRPYMTANKLNWRRKKLKKHVYIVYWLTMVVVGIGM